MLSVNSQTLQTIAGLISNELTFDNSRVKKTFLRQILLHSVVFEEEKDREKEDAIADGNRKIMKRSVDVSGDPRRSFLDVDSVHNSLREMKRRAVGTNAVRRKTILIRV